MRVDELLDVAGSALFGRRLFTDAGGDLTADQLLAASGRVRDVVAEAGGGTARQLVFVGVNSRAVPICLYGAAASGIPYTPVNYRLADDRLRALLERTAPSVAIADDDMAERIAGLDDVSVVATSTLLDRVLGDADAESGAADGGVADADPTAVLLFTSGTTGEPKAAVLGHDNLTSYVLSTVEFASAGDDEAAIVSVPPYHIAGVSAAVTSVFAGRRTVYLPAFDAADWVAAALAEGVTQAMVVPTMLEWILAELDRSGVELPDLRSLSYGGGPMPAAVIERAMNQMPHVDFVNAYGLTETASTVSILGPDDHRTAFASDDPDVRRRLRSVGRPLPTVELTIRDPAGDEVPAGDRGEVWVRGEQVSGRYVGADEPADGWFRTRDEGELDADGYLFLHGRLDDVIVRGGENLSPGEIEFVLVEHPAVAACAVVGIPDDEWGEAVAAAVVLEAGADVTDGELRDHVRSRLRSTQTPEVIRFYDELPMNETGKLLRRVVRADLADG